MYTHPQNGQKAIDVAPAPQATQLAAHRKAIEGLLATSEVISDQEFQAAAQRVNACHLLAVLAKWYRNCVREIARREESAPAEYATVAQREEIIVLIANPVLTRPERTQALLTVNRLDRAQAVAVIGNLYQKILDRGGVAPAPAGGRSVAAVTA